MKQKTLIALVLTGMSGLGSCVNAQPGKQIIDLDRPDYSLDVAHFYSESLGADHSASGEGGTEAGYSEAGPRGAFRISLGCGRR